MRNLSTLLVLALLFVSCSKSDMEQRSPVKKAESLFTFSSLTSETDPEAVQLEISRDGDGNLTVERELIIGVEEVRSYLENEGGVEIYTDSEGDDVYEFTGEETYFFIPFYNPDDYIESRPTGEKVTVSCECGDGSGGCSVSGSGSSSGGTHTLSCKSDGCSGCCIATVTITYEEHNEIFTDEATGPGIWVKGNSVTVMDGN